MILFLVSSLAFSAQEDYCVDPETKETVCESQMTSIFTAPADIRQSEICLGYSYFIKRSERKIRYQQKYLSNKENEILSELEMAKKGILDQEELSLLQQKVQKFDFQVLWINNIIEKTNREIQNYRNFGCSDLLINPSAKQDNANILAKKIMKTVWE